MPSSSDTLRRWSLALLLGVACARPSLPPSPTLAARAPDVPVVLGPSDDLCGAALLRALLLGYGTDVSIETLRPRLDIDETGANIDALEDTAIAYGLPAEQVMAPPDLALQSLDQYLPAIVVVGAAGRAQAFQLLWDLEADGIMEVLDCSRGRLLLPTSEVWASLYLHEMDVPADQVGEWLRSEAFGALVSRGLIARGVTSADATGVVGAAQRGEKWTEVAQVDAAARAAARMGQDPLWLIQTAQSQGAVAAGLVHADWYIRPTETPGTARIRGAVFLRVAPR